MSFPVQFVCTLLLNVHYLHQFRLYLTAKCAHLSDSYSLCVKTEEGGGGWGRGGGGGGGGEENVDGNVSGGSVENANLNNNNNNNNKNNSREGSNGLDINEIPNSHRD